MARGSQMQCCYSHAILVLYLLRDTWQGQPMQCCYSHAMIVSSPRLSLFNFSPPHLSSSSLLLFSSPLLSSSLSLLSSSSLLLSPFLSSSSQFLSLATTKRHRIILRPKPRCPEPAGTTPRIIVLNNKCPAGDNHE